MLIIMKKDFLEKLGLEKEVVDKIMAENGKDIEREKEKATKIQEQLEDVKGQLDDATKTLDGFKDVDVDELKGKIENLTKDLATKEAEYNANISKIQTEGKVNEFLSGKQFVNEATKKYYSSKMLEAMQSDEAKGKSLDDLLNGMTQNEKGEPLENIFVETEQKNKSVAVLNSGQPHGGAVETSPKTLQGALKEKFNLE